MTMISAYMTAEEPDPADPSGVHLTEPHRASRIRVPSVSTTDRAYTPPEDFLPSMELIDEAGVEVDDEQTAIERLFGL